FHAEDGIRDLIVTGVQTCALPILLMRRAWDLLCVVYYAPDRIQHYFWPELTGADGDPDVRRALDANYAALDEALGSLVAAAGSRSEERRVGKETWRAVSAITRS